MPLIGMRQAQQRPHEERYSLSEIRLRVLPSPFLLRQDESVDDPIHDFSANTDTRGDVIQQLIFFARMEWDISALWCSKWINEQGQCMEKCDRGRFR